MEITIESTIEEIYDYIKEMSTDIDDEMLEILFKLNLEMSLKEEITEVYFTDVTKFNLLLHRFVDEEEYEICARIKWYLNYIRKEYTEVLKEHYTYDDDDKIVIDEINKLSFPSTLKVWEKYKKQKKYEKRNKNN